jgi:hypothetical protein
VVAIESADASRGDAATRHPSYRSRLQPRQDAGRATILALINQTYRDGYESEIDGGVKTAVQ